MDSTKYDLYRFTGRLDRASYFRTFLMDRTFRRIVYYRKYQTSGGLLKKLVKMLNHFLARKMTLDLPLNIRLGKGILFIHPYDIALNSESVIGDNCTILKGATVGNSKTGKVGAPIIGKNVYIGPNASIVGHVTVGDNVLIAANAFVNFDVPDNSVVIGNPGVIHHKENASASYIVNSIDAMGQGENR